MSPELLNRLASEKEVLKWDADSEFRDKYNRSTREGRIQYIYRGVNRAEIFSDFIDKDISSKLSFLSILQRGVHELNPDLNAVNLESIKTIMECTLVSMIEITKLQ